MPDPRDLRARALALRAEADQVEAAAFRLALEQADWLVARAAGFLDIPTSTMVRLLAPGHRHAELGRELAAHRASGTYRTGRPATKRKTAPPP